MVEVVSVDQIIEKISPHYAKRAKAKKIGKVNTVPESIHKLIYDSPTETLEPVYFWILDLMKDFGYKIEKLVDNFVSSPGSQHFGEMGQRSSIMQQQGSKLLADINTVLRSVLNLIYDLKDFKMRLQHYKDLEDPNKKEAAYLSLKQIWMDKVDMARGNSSIKAMALGQGGFTTLIDAFLIVKDSKDIDKLDLNYIVKRVLKPRLAEFNIWLKQSQLELQKRYEIERTYLKSQVNSLKIYARWAKPYLKAAQDLEQLDASRNPALVKMFNSLVLELTLLGKRKVSLDYPHKYNQKRDYYICTLVDFNFRGIPNKTQQGFVIGGRAEVTFRSYVLNEEELKKLDQELDSSDLNNALGLIESSTTESLDHLEEDIKEFIEEEDKSRGKEKSSIKDKKPSDVSNPFLALFGFYNEKSEKKKEDQKDSKIEEIKKDDWVEENYLRKFYIFDTKETTYKFFDLYKKAHRMPSFPFPPLSIHPFERK
ncbi:MAG: hypothetical protein U9Q99_00160 [Nanoarchaeota archaeon]|nr:hypothetical protein [Nanoarchaeota archaeon]